MTHKDFFPTKPLENSIIKRKVINCLKICCIKSKRSKPRIIEFTYNFNEDSKFQYQ